VTAYQTLGSILTTTKGKKPKTLRTIPGSGLVPYIDISAVERGTQRQWADPTEGRIVPAGSLVIVWDGARSGWVGLTKFEGALGSTLAALESPVNKRFLAALLKAHFQDINSNNRGSGIPHVDPDYLRALLVPIVSEREQLRIADLTEAAAANVATITQHLSAASRAIDRFRQSVLAAACSGRLTADWRATHPDIDVCALAADLADRKANRSSQRARAVGAIAELDLPEIPQSWSWMSVDSISRAVVDGVHKTPNYVNSGVPFITVRNLTAGAGIDFERVKYISEADHRAFTARTKPERGDILVSKDGTLGVVRQIDIDREFSIFVSVAMVKPLLFEMSDYLVIALSSPQVQTQMVGVGSGLVHLVLRDLKADGIPVPPMEEQHEIVARVQALMELADVVSERIDRLSANVDRAAIAVLSMVTQGASMVNHEGDQ